MRQAQEQLWQWIPVTSCRSANRTEIICVCSPIPKELTWLQRLPKEVGTFRSIPLKAKDNAACVVLEMQKSPHNRYTKCSQTKGLFPSKNVTTDILQALTQASRQANENVLQHWARKYLLFFFSVCYPSIPNVPITGYSMIFPSLAVSEDVNIPNLLEEKATEFSTYSGKRNFSQ